VRIVEKGSVSAEMQSPEGDGRFIQRGLWVPHLAVDGTLEGCSLVTRIAGRGVLDCS
jgi:hypothetical protein